MFWLQAHDDVIVPIKRHIATNLLIKMRFAFLLGSTNSGLQKHNRELRYLQPICNDGWAMNMNNEH